MKNCQTFITFLDRNNRLQFGTMSQIMWIKNTLQFFTFLICIIVFLWQILDLSSSYFEGHEAISQENTVWKEKLPVPVLYFCLQDAFHNDTLHYYFSKQTYFENVKRFNITAKLILVSVDWTEVDLTDKLSFEPLWDNGLCAKLKFEEKIAVGNWLTFDIAPVGNTSNQSIIEVSINIP